MLSLNPARPPRAWLSHATWLIAAILCGPLTAHAQDDYDNESSAVGSDDGTRDIASDIEDVRGEGLEADLRAAGADLDTERTEAASEAATSTEPDPLDSAVPASLPTGDSKSAVTPQAISLPGAEGSIEGMGESFSPVLSSGTGTFGVPIALPAGRAGVQPSLSLSYSTSGGNGALGVGWGMGAPFIARQTDRGVPRYVDESQWHEAEDRFIYNGGQELVPVDSDAIAAVDGYAGAEQVPSEVDGWQQYRAKVEGGFMRFFRSPDSMRWVVQGKDGTRFDFGLLPSTQKPPGFDARPSLTEDVTSGDGVTRVFSWHLTRMSDAHGSTVYYAYERDRGQCYLRDIFYLSPASCGGGSVESARDCDADLDDYGVRVHLQYEGRQDVLARYNSGFRTEMAQRLKRVIVTSAHGTLPFSGPLDTHPTDAGRYLVRKYHLDYVPASQSFHSLLASVQVEGRPDTTIGTGIDARQQYTHIEEGAAIATGSVVVGRTLPAMRFEYTDTPDGPIPGFGGVANDVIDVTGSPNEGVDASRADLFDVNSDGLPDLIVTDPARYRTADGSPAVGVFFNGFQGASATPAGRAATFSSAIPVGVPSGRSGTLLLGNNNILPMDLDGDGRSDLLNLPRRTDVGFFTPTRISEDEAGSSVSPADQGWRFTYANVNLRSLGSPLIDVGSDGARYKVFDVDGDHLIDIVHTTGTVMQTWRNLGWHPDGDGKFGSATFTGSGWELSNRPHESCLLHDGLPVDFADPEVRLADMNGDGLQDIVKLRRGRLIYWPGRGVNSAGEPIFGEGPADCGRHEGDDREVVVANAPRVDFDLDSVYLTDVNADGATDVVQVRFNEVDVWFNQAGRSFTDRITVDSAYAPSFDRRIRFTDLDGSGTLDIVYGYGTRWQYVDLLGGVRPRLLKHVENGLGGTTDLSYSTSAQDYLQDLEDAADCAGCEKFTWSHVAGECDQRLQEMSGECVYRSGASPVVSTVVRSITTSDNFALGGHTENVTTTRFAYHDGYYEGIEQEFRGFGAADAESIGDATHPTVFARSFFHQGRRPQSIASDRLAENPYESLKGRQWLSESFDEGGRYLSSAHATCAVRHLHTGLDGRDITYAYVSQTDELRYDTDGAATNSWIPGTDSIELPIVQHQGPGGAETDVDDITHQVPIRGATYAHIRGTTPDVDNLGHVKQQVAHGRVLGEHGETPDERIYSFTNPALINGAAWIFRTTSGYTTADPAGERFGETLTTHNELGDAILTTQLVHNPVALDFPGGPDGQLYALMPGAGESIVASTKVDAWGNATASCAGEDINSAAIGPVDCWRYSEVEYDGDFAQLPVKERHALGLDADIDDSACRGSVDGQLCMLQTSAAWDRGFGVIRETLAIATGLRTVVNYDGLGRFTATYRSGGSELPATVVRYELVPDGLPLSRVQTIQRYDVKASNQVKFMESRTFVDGLGRTRGALTKMESATAWQRAGIGVFTARGTVARAFDNDDLYGTSDPSHVDGVRIPDRAFVSSEYDAFGRVRATTERDGSRSMTRYHALSTESWDPNDLGAGAPHFDSTPSVTRVDGHGRAIESVLTNRQLGGGNAVYYKLNTTYRADGAVLSVTRSQTTGAQVGAAVVDDHTQTREFEYDSIGRRLTSTDPDSDDPSGTGTDAQWRYLFNRVGDLVAVRDPRGCGQNFYYDRAGRLLGEDAIECAESQEPGDKDAAGETGDEVEGAYAMTAGVDHVVDARSYYDRHPDFLPINRGRTLGFMTGSSDRGQRSASWYDARGRVLETRRQMAVIPQAHALSATSFAEGDPVPTETVTSAARVFDPHVYVTRTTTNKFDHLDRALEVIYPEDHQHGPSGGGAGPDVRGSIVYGLRGLPSSIRYHVDGLRKDVIRSIGYNRHGLPFTMSLGDNRSGRSSSQVKTSYDIRQRPTDIRLERTPESGATGISALSVPFAYRYDWDQASNLTRVTDTTPDRDLFPAGHLVSRRDIEHDALYRVANVNFSYRSTGSWMADDTANNWRDAYDAQRAGDPMHRKPAEAVTNTATDRVKNLAYEYDWLANQTEWTDDASQFFERSLGTEIVNGHDIGERPSALYFATDIPDENGAGPRGGWVKLTYGASGNVTEMVVRGTCENKAGEQCTDPGASSSPESRDAALVAGCACEVQQHFVYRWDEMNRLAEARRYDRDGEGLWEQQVRQRYRYDAGNVRTVKQTISDVEDSGMTLSDVERVALYVLPGDMERRGLVSTMSGYEVSPVVPTETQYLIGGARLVFKSAKTSRHAGFTRDYRVTYAVTDLLQSTTAVLDLWTGELLSVGNFYPNGGRENLWTNEDVDEFEIEPLGFTGKEADDEVGLVYFGERYLIPRVGRWASPDPLEIHQPGEGGEFANAYHYVSGNLLQARDPLGLSCWRTPNAWAACLAESIGTVLEYGIGGRTADTTQRPRGPDRGLGGRVGGQLRAASFRLLDGEENPSRLSRAGMEDGAGDIPVADAAMRLATGRTVTGRPASRSSAGLELAAELLTGGLVVAGSARAALRTPFAQRVLRRMRRQPRPSVRPRNMRGVQDAHTLIQRLDGALQRLDATHQELSRAAQSLKDANRRVLQGINRLGRARNRNNGSVVQQAQRDLDAALDAQAAAENRLQGAIDGAEAAQEEVARLDRQLRTAERTDGGE